MSARNLLVCGISVLCACVAVAAPSGEQQLAELRHRFLNVQQGWGEMGFNRAAHLPGQQGEVLKIGNREYDKGIGHHASGEILVELGGEYSTFESIVGVQAQPSGGGSVVFKVFVDDELRFDSGIMKADTPARKISVPVAGAQELRLVLTDAGDGIESDLGDWADARLVRASEPAAVKAGQLLDLAPFAQVVTYDPSRADGARSSRIQEYRAEDIYLETPVVPNADGVYTSTPNNGKAACLGLKWIERRRLRQIGFELADASVAPAVEDVKVDCWVGESAWQGGWKRLGGDWKRQDAVWTFHPDWASVAEARAGTRKIRITAPSKLAIRKFTALAATLATETNLHIEIENPPANARAAIEFYNCERAGTDQNRRRTEWDASQSLDLTVRYTKPRPWIADFPVLRFHLPKAEFGVAVEDVLNNGCVYVRDFGLFVTRDPVGLSLAAYKQKIAGKQTVLQQVRTMPDQTFAQAIQHVHNPAQNLPPTMLSLACDNNKFVLNRNGTVEFSAVPENNAKHMGDLHDFSSRVVPSFGSGKVDKITRRLDGNWMPIVVNEIELDGIMYRQRSFAAPWGKGGSVGVLEFVAQNNGNAAANATIKLAFLANAGKDDAAELSTVPIGAIAYRRGRLLAAVHADRAAPLKLDVSPAGTVLSGSLPPRVTSRIVVFIPTVVMKPEQHTQLANADELLRATREYWQQQLASAMQIDLPDPLLVNAIKASQVHCLIAARSEENGSRVAPWIASVAYGPLESESNSIIRGMDFFGHHEFARRSLDFFIHRYSPEGFLTTGYTMMGNGWHLWMLGEHYTLARDKEWLGKVAPEVSRLCKWIIRQREKTMKTWADGSKSPEYGLVPPGVMADWNAFAYYFCLNGYYCAGLRTTADALTDIGVKDAAGWRDAANQFRDDLLKSYAWTRSRMPVYALRDGTSVPGYPSSVYGPGPTARFFPGEDGNRSWCYDIEIGAHHLVPFGILDPGSPDVAWMMDHMEDVRFLSDGWFDYPAKENGPDWYNRGGFAKVQPYYCRNVEVCAMRDDVKPFIRSYFNTIPSLLNMENLSFQEHFKGVGAWNKTHETGYFLHQTRLMLVQERGDDLWLAPFVTNNWLKDGQSVTVAKAPTRFGPVSYRITSALSQAAIDATIEPPTRTSPRQIVLRLRHPEGKPMKKVMVNGKPHEDFDPAKEVIRTSPTSEKITVRASY